MMREGLLVIAGAFAGCVFNERSDKGAFLPVFL